MLTLPAQNGQQEKVISGSRRNSTLKVEGASDENPICLPQESVNEFCDFLWLFYSPDYHDTKPPVLTWLSILRLEHLWDFPKARSLAFRKLRNAPTALRLAIGRRYDAKKDWCELAMSELAKRRQPFSQKEKEELGLELTKEVIEARKKIGKEDLGMYKCRCYSSSMWDGPFTPDPDKSHGNVGNARKQSVLVKRKGKLSGFFQPFKKR